MRAGKRQRRGAAFLFAELSKLADWSNSVGLILLDKRMLSLASSNQVVDREEGGQK
jgi:hypothetical protein